MPMKPDPFNDVFSGRAIVRPASLRAYLKKSHYFARYDAETMTFDLSGNHGGGGETLLRLENIPYESAVKLAEGLGLEGRGDRPVEWGKWNPVYRLNHDGSEAANRVLIEVMKAGIPLEIRRGCATREFFAEPYRYSLKDDRDLEHVLDRVRVDADRYAKLLATTP